MTEQEMDFDFIGIRKAHVYLRDQLAGILEKKSTEEFIFKYFDTYIEKGFPSIAISLPIEKKIFLTKKLHPFFDNMIAEGWLLAHTEQIFRIDKSNRFALLMATGTAPIGAVRVVPLGDNGLEISLQNHYKDNLKIGDMGIYTYIPNEKPEFCPYCLESLTEKQKLKSDFHPQCAKNMWGSTRKLKFYFDKKKPMSSFIKVIYGGSISGYQKKGLFKLEGGIVKPISFGAQYILKPQGDLNELPENEHLTMAIAKKLNFDIPPFTMLKFEKLGNVFAVKRFDINKDNEMRRMEDMGQILSKEVSDKYSSSCEKVGQVISDNSSAPPIDLYSFWRRILFAYFTANGDMHLKNWSLLEHKELNGSMALSPCYDLLNTRLALPNESIDIGIAINGKRKNLQRSYFIKLGETLKISDTKIKQTLDDVHNWLNVAREMIPRSYLNKESQEEYLKIINERYQKLIK
ncbi:MAG: hypothetical protein A2381_12265 [Bdellovibrionales bacterium RIFOXYB1_FULL_37_110]|nr:MAG: hypothetical protein A2181_01985 [Bdellovibrionales bacterium RIFOXYA1_FULL_38_20]OFZ52270.1 MAG: hypothetical protein A2417_06105 [Bdellovibrionales bacterium RIFOXYC1_FULL_37_79]OFZ57257.1 MAG: hypothetical protein A2381_12265 [Bdellovibrionales bacterium RIFOXYB1_FULL_37_110]OFZ65259.1 MAG: hypothetical protein A2577_04700 [Bdellovibrionales bacterium RIFOXYD1_FULL_36_51]